MRKLLALVAILTMKGVCAQTITLHFPHFANKEYAFIIFHGDQTDTIIKNSLDSKGRAILKLPEGYKDYKGMSKWYLLDGGGLDMVINNETFSVESLSASPSDDNIIYSGSAENTFIREQFAEQERLLAKMEAVRLTMNVYSKADTLYGILEQEQSRLESQFEKFQLEANTSSLYAAAFRQIANSLAGLGSKLYDTEESRVKALSQFYSDSMDVEVLYTSSLWSRFFESWLALYLNHGNNDVLLLQDTKKILARIQSQPIYTAFAEKLILLFAKYGKDNLIQSISTEIAHSGKLENPSSYIKLLTNATIGSEAPFIEGLSKTAFRGNKTILVFYESGCGNCERQIQKLIAEYPNLHKKGIQVISVTSEKDILVARTYSNAFPWKVKICNGESDDFYKYGIIGTPTFITVNEQGIITGRYAQLEDVLVIK